MPKNLTRQEIQSAVEKNCGRVFTDTRIMQLATKWGGLITDKKKILIKPEIAEKIIKFLTMSAELRKMSGAKK